MILGNITIGAANWLPFAAVMFAILAIAMLWSYWTARTKPFVRVAPVAVGKTLPPAALRIRRRSLRCKGS